VNSAESLLAVNAPVARRVVMPSSLLAHPKDSHMYKIAAALIAATFSLGAFAQAAAPAPTAAPAAAPAATAAAPVKAKAAKKATRHAKHAKAKKAKAA